jgi:hypothetical protein
MRMKAQEYWHCSDAGCGCVVLVQSSGSEDGSNPRCSCGAAMKKKYVSPVLSYLDFLKLEETPNPRRTDLNHA